MTQQNSLPGFPDRTLRQFIVRWMRLHHPDRSQTYGITALVDEIWDQIPAPFIRAWYDSQTTRFKAYVRESVRTALRSENWVTLEGNAGPIAKRAVIHIPYREVNGRPGFQDARQAWIAKLRIGGATLAAVRTEIEEFAEHWNGYVDPDTGERFDIDVDATFHELCAEAAIAI